MMFASGNSALGFSTVSRGDVAVGVLFDSVITIGFLVVMLLVAYEEQEDWLPSRCFFFSRPVHCLAMLYQAC
jgi:hypothetical protein